MGACEPGQARDRAAISGNFHVPGFSLKAVFFCVATFRFFRIFPFFVSLVAVLGRRRSFLFFFYRLFFPSFSFAVFPIPPALSFSLKPFHFFEKFC